jgi:hypothetical protein
MTASNGSAANRPPELSPQVPPPALTLKPPMVGRNGWNWVDRHGEEAAAMAERLHGFVAYFNDRYAWTADHLIPACWARHGALVEEITTLMWSRWSAFESPDATAEAAQSWHTYYLPGFLARVHTWLGSAGPECRAGHHEPSAIPERRTATAAPARPAPRIP